MSTRGEIVFISKGRTLRLYKHWDCHVEGTLDLLYNIVAQIPKFNNVLEEIASFTELEVLYIGKTTEAYDKIMGGLHYAYVIDLDSKIINIFYTQDRNGDYFSDSNTIIKNSPLDILERIHRDRKSVSLLKTFRKILRLGYTVNGIKRDIEKDIEDLEDRVRGLEEILQSMAEVLTFMGGREWIEKA